MQGWGLRAGRGLRKAGASCFPALCSRAPVSAGPRLVRHPGGMLRSGWQYALPVLVTSLLLVTMRPAQLLSVPTCCPGAAVSRCGWVFCPCCAGPACHHRLHMGLSIKNHALRAGPARCGQLPKTPTLVSLSASPVWPRRDTCGHLSQREVRSQGHLRGIGSRENEGAWGYEGELG